MRFYKSRWFWIPLIIFFIIGILLQIMVSRGLAENTSSAPSGSIGGLIAGLAIGIFLWLIFGRIDKIKIPEYIESGFEFPVYLIFTTDTYSPEFATKIANKMNFLTGQNRRAYVSSSINPKLVIYPDRLRYKVVSDEKEIKYSDINLLDVLTGWVPRGMGKNFSLAYGYAMNINLTLKNKNRIIFNLHRKDNLIELLRFFQSKRIPLSENARNLLTN